MTSTSELLKEGIEAAKAKKDVEARDLLKQVVELEPRNETAWLWLSAVIHREDERLICLENVLAVNPENEAAQRGVKILRRSLAPLKPLPDRDDALRGPVTQATDVGAAPLARSELESRARVDGPPAQASEAGPFGLDQVPPEGATLRMFSSVKGEQPVTFNQALEEMECLRQDPKWVNENFLGFVNDQGEVVQFAAVDFERDTCHLDIPLTVEGGLSLFLAATLTVAEGLSLVRSFYAGASSRLIARALLTAPRERPSVSDEIAGWGITSAIESYYFLLDVDDRVVCHIGPIGHTTRADELASSIIEDLPLRLVSVTELMTEGRQGENSGEVPVDDGSRSKRSSRLTQCVDCGGQISTSAAACPHCGRPHGEADAQPMTPRCPTCNSTRIEKISASDKAGSALLFGVFSIGQISKTFRCRDCGYKW